MSGQPTRLDAGRGSVVAWCRSCPPWRRIGSDRADALRLAADHLELVHGATRAAAKLREQARAAAATAAARHAELTERARRHG